MPRNANLSDRFKPDNDDIPPTKSTRTPVSNPVFVESTLKQKPNSPKRTLATNKMLVIYAVVFLISVLGVYGWQHSKAQNSQKILASAQTIPDESANIEKNNNQAVFLNNGQVYFGKITQMNKEYVTLTNIYYLRATDQTSAYDQTKAAAANQTVSLVKLGCEIHGPSDKMVINRIEVSFWENMQPNGRVSKAITDYQTKNPTASTCTS